PRAPPRHHRRPRPRAALLAAPPAVNHSATGPLAKPARAVPSPRTGLAARAAASRHEQAAGAPLKALRAARRPPPPRSTLPTAFPRLKEAPAPPPSSTTATTLSR